MQTNTNT